MRRGKNGTARYVPLAPSTVLRLRAYRAERTRLLGSTPGPFFRMESGEHPTDCCARYNFALVIQALGLRAPQRFCKHGRGPRIHDLRHTFAVRTIIGWYRKGLDPDREMIKLSTYLGQRVLAMPAKRHEKRAIDYLDRDEIGAVIAAPDLSTWHGRRDRAILLLTLQTGLRVTELITLTRDDIALGAGAHVCCMGKGRKERATPIRKDSIKLLRDWLAERKGKTDDPLFISNRGTRLSRDAVEGIVRRHVETASKTCRSLRSKRVAPHVLRHSAAMQLLHGGVDRTVIALWLGHESVETTQMYIHADMKMKEKAIAKTRPVEAKHGRYRPSDKLLSFLEAL